MEDARGPSATTTARETFHTMPHLDLSDEDLESLHPRILAPPEEPLHDFVQDDHDPVYQYGFKVAKDVQDQADELGRKRHPDARKSTGAARSTTRKATSGPPKSGHALVAPSTTTTTQVDNAGTQTADGFGPVRAPGQPTTQYRSQPAARRQSRSQQNLRSNTNRDKPVRSMSPSPPAQRFPHR